MKAEIDQIKSKENSTTKLAIQPGTGTGTETETGTGRGRGEINENPVITISSNSNSNMSSFNSSNSSERTMNLSAENEILRERIQRMELAMKQQLERQANGDLEALKLLIEKRAEEGFNSIKELLPELKPKQI